MEKHETLRQLRNANAQLRKASWSKVASHLLGGVVLVILAVALGQSNWRVPNADDLTRVQGTFASRPEHEIGPYVFITGTGDHLLLGCDPGQGATGCLEDQGVSMRSLVGEPASIGYFHASAPWWRFRRNYPREILVTLEVKGQALLSFESSRTRLKKDLQIHAVSEFVPRFFLALIGALQIYLAIRISRAKLKQADAG